MLSGEQDLGFTNETGYTRYPGIQISTANTTGKMAFMGNLVGLYIYQNNAGGIEYQERYGRGNKK